MFAFTDPPSSLRMELQEFIRSCENLLSSTVFPFNVPLAPDERPVVEYYVKELKTYLLLPRRH